MPASVVRVRDALRGNSLPIAPILRPARRHAQGNVQLQGFLRAFMELLGDHFTRLGEAAPPPSPAPPPPPPQALECALPAGAADADVQAVLAHPELAALLADARTRQLLRECAEGGPRALAAALRQPAQRAALALLARHGLVRFE